MNIDDSGVIYYSIDNLKFLVVKNKKIYRICPKLTKPHEGAKSFVKLCKVRVWFWLNNVTFNSIYVISLRSFLLLFFFLLREN